MHDWHGSWMARGWNPSETASARSQVAQGNPTQHQTLPRHWSITCDSHPPFAMGYCAKVQMRMSTILDLYKGILPFYFEPSFLKPVHQDTSFHSKVFSDPVTGYSSSRAHTSLFIVHYRHGPEQSRLYEYCWRVVQEVRGVSLNFVYIYSII